LKINHMNETMYDEGEDKRMDAITEVAGTPYEQGVEQGKKLHDDIVFNVKIVQDYMDKNVKKLAVYQEFVHKNEAFMLKFHPDLVEEMKGIAKGSGMSYESILWINIPAYFMTDRLNQECSMIMARGKATADGCTYLIKNRDMSLLIKQAVISRTYPDGSHIVELNGAGVVTYPGNGFNDSGLAVATTGFWSKKAPAHMEDVGASHIFVNIHLLLANCKTVWDVAEYLKTSPRMNGLNMIAVDKTDAIAIETTRDSMVIEKDTGDGLLFRTNHYISEELKHLNPDPGEYVSTFKRYGRIAEITKERYGKIRFQDMFRILSDHKNGTNCICRHPSEAAKAKTVSSSLVVLDDLEMWTSLDNPCMSLRFAGIQGDGETK